MDMKAENDALGVKEIFAPVKWAEYQLWAIAMAAMVLLLFPGSRKFYVAKVVAAGTDPRLVEWQSILWHHGATLLVFTLPLLLMAPLGIYRKGLGLFAPGDWRWGLTWTLVACAVVTGPTWVSSSDPEFTREYPLAMHAFDSAPLFALFLFSTQTCHFPLPALFAEAGLRLTRSLFLAMHLVSYFLMQMVARLGIFTRTFPRLLLIRRTRLRPCLYRRIVRTRQRMMRHKLFATMCLVGQIF